MTDDRNGEPGQEHEHPHSVLLISGIAAAVAGTIAVMTEGDDGPRT